ncbi:MAG TPA: hypothetical protein VFS55_01055 [Dokdonella sp.]|nr:hypothetical protein [Dokdonella sp.]
MKTHLLQAVHQTAETETGSPANESLFVASIGASGKVRTLHAVPAPEQPYVDPPDDYVLGGYAGI